MRAKSDLATLDMTLKFRIFLNSLEVQLRIAVGIATACIWSISGFIK